MMNKMIRWLLLNYFIHVCNVMTSSFQRLIFVNQVWIRGNNYYLFNFRKVNMLAREYADKASDAYKPIIMSHHMMMGLLEG